MSNKKASRGETDQSDIHHSPENLRSTLKRETSPEFTQVPGLGLQGELKGLGAGAFTIPEEDSLG